MPARINHVRIGEAILLGRETVHREPWPNTFADCFVLYGEIIELKEKPSVPIGPRGENAFGQRPEFEERGTVARALVNLGREDVDVGGLTPRDPGILGASSDCLIVDVTGAARETRVGAELAFHLNYPALLAAMDSQYVQKRFVGARAAR